MNEDHAHVLLDALIELDISIERRAGAPWKDYAGFEDDPKASPDGYRGLITEARQHLERCLETGDFQ